MKQKILLFIVIIVLSQSTVIAGGISTDAGLTPAQDRWIFRTQYRFMGIENSMMQMNTQMIPVVLAYGITSGFSLMARGMYVRRSFNNSTEIENGANDLYLLSKFRLYRKNTSSYVFGVAPHLASNIPVGTAEISNRTWNPEIGLNISFRPRFLAVDLSTSYTFNDALEKLNTEHVNLFNLNIAFSGNIPIKAKSSQAVSPVLEINYSVEGSKNKETGASEMLFISPGLTFIYSSLALEGLFQIPAYQSTSGNIRKQQSRWILGVKYMF